MEGSTLAGHLPVTVEPGGATTVGAPVIVAGESGADAPECEECGAPVAFRAGRNGTVLAVCTDCESTVVYRPEGAERSREERPRFTPRDRAPASAEGGPRSRPCRKCGAPLRFTTGDDGVLVGECDSCGNRFTLPPREGPGARPRYGGRPSFQGRRDYRGGGGSRPPFRGRPGGTRRAYPDRNRRDRSEDDDERPRRRRPRDE